MSSKLVNAIRSAVGKVTEDIIYIFTGEVVDNSNAMIDGTIEVIQISGKVSSTIANKNALYSYNQQTAGDINNNLLNGQAGPLTFTVDLQAQIGDTLFVVPVIGSYVTCIRSTYQNPFVISFQDAQFFSNAIGDTTYIMDAAGQTFSAANAMNLSIDSGSIISLNGTVINLSVPDGASLNLDTKFNVLAHNGAEIMGDTKLTIKTTSASLKDLLTDVKTCLNDMANATIPTSSPTTLGTLNPDILVQVTNISTLINALLE